MSQNTDDNLSLESLRQELQSKNEVIAALTEQLEGTADQLDRLQRSGVRSNGESSGRAGLGLAGQVEEALEAFDELNPSEHFERLESGIEQILEVLSGRLVPESSEDDEPDQDEAPSDNEFWNATKERLLEDEANSSAELCEDSITDELKTDSVGRLHQDSTAERIAPPPLADPPKPIDDLQDPDILEEGITERDSYIVSLIARLRTLEENQYPPINWTELSEAPEELKVSLISLEKQLKDNLLRAEVSVALERASLTRERSKLFHVKRQLEQEVKRIGLAAVVDSQEEEGKQSANSRWEKFFEAEQ